MIKTLQNLLKQDKERYAVTMLEGIIPRITRFMRVRL